MFMVAALGLGALSGAAPLPAGSASDAGFSEARLARIDAHMNAAVAAGEMVGGMGLIARDGIALARFAAFQIALAALPGMNMVERKKLL
jgi:hypothetical protein